MGDAGRPPGVPDARSESRSKGGLREVFPTPLKFMVYGVVFLVGYLLALMYSGWEQQRFVESWVHRNRVRIAASPGASGPAGPSRTATWRRSTGPLEIGAKPDPAGGFYFAEIRPQLPRGPAGFGHQGTVRQYVRRGRTCSAAS